MTRLLYDRYLRLDGNRACDLATGAEVPLDALAPAACADDDPALLPLIEALDQGRDGFPRWLVAAAATRRQMAAAIEGLTVAAARRGFVTLSVDAYLKFRDTMETDLRDRALLLCGGGSAHRSRAHAALLLAASASSRPHCLLTFDSVPAASKLTLVREARAAYPASVPAARPESPDIVQLIRRASGAKQLVAEGRHAAAARLLREIAASLARRRAFGPASRTMISLAQLLLDRDGAVAASSVLDEAARLAQCAGDEDLLVQARLHQASARIANAALIEGESLCRAVLANSALPPHLGTWARAVLAESLLWQGRVDEVPEIDAAAVTATLQAEVAAILLDIEVRTLLAKGRIFDAGRCVECLQTLAASAGTSLVSVVAHGADLQALVSVGDLKRGRAACDAALSSARLARAPFRAAWAQIAWVEALRRAGRVEDARVLQRLKRIGRVAPLLLQREIMRVVAGSKPSTSVPAVSRDHPRSSSLSVALVRLAQDEDDDRAAIAKLLERVSVELQATRIDLLSSDAGPPTTVCNVGAGLPTSLGVRVLETAFGIGPERCAGGVELGLPIRAGPRTIGALACRWPMDREMPRDAAEVLDLAAVIVAPRADALRLAQRNEARASTAVPELVGVSDAIVSVRGAIVRAASAPFALLIEGESGVGKELVARAVHQLSPRRERRFCDINCAALPEDLLESELFGHARGAFSGAVVDRAGMFEEADGGTLFLDEVADLSPRAQAKLLRALQQQEVRRVGESFSRKVDVRIVAAANRDMRAEATAGRFRQDLLYRLDVIRIRIPPLRDRPDDIPVLAERCWRAAAARVGSRAELSPAVLAELTRYPWPGNVRELQNVIAALAVAAPLRGRVRPTLLPPVITASTSVLSGRLAEARAQFERRFIEVALTRAGGNRARAARSLGLSRQGLSKTMKRLGFAPGC